MSERLELVRIADGDVEVEIVPAVGARLHRLRFRGHDLLRTPADLERHVDDPYFWGSYPMAPWCNRIAAGRTAAVAGRDLDLPVSFRDGTAIHGQVSQVPWSRADDRTFRIRAGRDGWPWPYEVEQRFDVTDGGLLLGLRLTNLADDPMPAGLGIHPWFRRPVDVRIAAAAAYRTNVEPAADPEPVDGALDLRALGPFPTGLDATWTALGEPPVAFRWPAIGIAATMRTKPAVPYIVAAGPADIEAVAVEPQTHAPAGIRRLQRGEPGALEILAAGATLALEIRLDLSGET